MTSRSFLNQCMDPCGKNRVCYLAARGNGSVDAYRRLTCVHLLPCSDALLAHVTRFVGQGPAVPSSGGSSSSSSTLVNRLCLALSCLLVQMRTVRAEDAFDAVLQAFPPGSAGTLACVEIIATLAEEAANPRTPIPSARREAFLDGLRSRSDAALAALQVVLSAGAAAGNVSWIERVFKCFGSWVAGAL